MAITTRQTGLLVAEDWTKLYQTFRNADFQSYDYETLRKSMIDYLRLYYPEDFNDFIESSEFIALIDLIAFLGQSLAFRGDLNARENFIDTAQRRDSILKLAKLISYNPKRNIPASGFLKIDSVSTTEVVYDSNGVNLSNLLIEWNDAGDDNWLEQFTAVVNASLVNNQVVGKPSSSKIINGVTNDEYQVNLLPDVLPVYSFESTIEGSKVKFEVVSPTSANESFIYEAAPRAGQYFNMLYKSDGLGNSSPNTGFFLYFKQGELRTQDFNFQESIPNRVFNINSDNVNNTDVWLYSLNIQRNPDTLWESVPTVNNTNVIYNKSANRNLYQVNSRASDQIDLVFGDGAFSNVPQGNFRLYYRVSNGLEYKITPAEMQGVIININYVSRVGQIETLTVRASLQYTVANSTTRESLEDIRQKAPQQYYTQDRMITGEDYNILPYTLFSNVLKSKAVNRTSSGVSRYLDVIDTTGKYSSTNIFASDGLLYRELVTQSFSFEFNTRNDIYRTIYNRVSPIISEKEIMQMFYAYYPAKPLLTTYWHFTTELANGATGYFYDLSGKIIQVGETTSSNAQFIKQHAIVRFSAGTGNYFDSRNRIKVGTPAKPGDRYYIYAAVQKLVGDGTNGGIGNLLDGTGPITLNQVVPDGAIVDEIYPVFKVELSNLVIETMVSYIQAYEDFGLRYDVTLSEWQLILPQDLNTGDFSLDFEGDTSGSGKDSSWLIRFATSGKAYTVYHRGLNYVFESIKETNFYFDDRVKIYDPKTGLTINDQIKVLKINNNPDSSEPLAVDYTWYIYKNVVEADGYENSNKVLITFPDSDNDGIPDNPKLFELLVNPLTNQTSKYVFFETSIGYENFIETTPVDNNTIISEYTILRDAQQAATLYRDGQKFYISDTNEFYQLSVNGSNYTLLKISGLIAKEGRQDLYFQYRHNSPNYRRIDPSPNNIIDIYLLTKQYANDYVNWIRDVSGTVVQPEKPTGEGLALEFKDLENYKGISDTIIFNPAKFKPIFGDKADSVLQATFKVVKNPSVIVSDNDVKTSVIAAINSYFDISNWDFGETFYFSELSAYLHNVLAPNLASITIVPASESTIFGSLLQINAEYNEIIISCATVDNVQIIPAITAAQLNQA